MKGRIQGYKYSLEVTYPTGASTATEYLNLFNAEGAYKRFCSHCPPGTVVQLIVVVREEIESHTVPHAPE